MFDSSLLSIERDEPASLQRQLYGQLRSFILAGRLTPGSRLPSSRSLAEDLGVSRNTVLSAFDQLTAEGYLEGRQGAGSFVATDLPTEELMDGRFAAPEKTNTPVTLSNRGRDLTSSIAPGRRGARAFRAGYPDIRLFPFDIWSRLLARVWRRPTDDLVNNIDPSGYPPLRRAIADYLKAMRGVRCDADQVMILSGVQQAIAIATTALCDIGDRVLVEDPGYPGVRGAFKSCGVVPTGLPIDAEGVWIEAAPEAKLLCTAPSHQFPLGVTMSLARRLALIEWAAQSDAWILEDDYDSEYRYTGKPLPALQGLDPHDRVIYMGSFSKVMFPTIRIGYLVAPPALVEPFRRVRAALDGHPASSAQPALTAFIEEGHFAAHMRRMRKVYGERQRNFIDQAAHHLGDRLDITPSPVGMSLVGRLRQGLDDRTAAILARANDVDLVAIGSYYAEPVATQLLHLGYTACDARETDAALRRLAKAWATG